MDTLEKPAFEPSYFPKEVEHGMAILDHTGDTKLMWDPNNKSETDHAKETFNKFVKTNRYLAYKTDKNGDKSEQIREFDPSISRMILVAPMAGG